MNAKTRKALAREVIDARESLGMITSRLRYNADNPLTHEEALAYLNRAQARLVDAKAIVLADYADR